MRPPQEAAGAPPSPEGLRPFQALGSIHVSRTQEALVHLSEWVRVCHSDPFGTATRLVHLQREDERGRAAKESPLDTYEWQIGTFHPECSH